MACCLPESLLLLLGDEGEGEGDTEEDGGGDREEDDGDKEDRDEAWEEYRPKNGDLEAAGDDEEGDEVEDANDKEAATCTRDGGTKSSVLSSTRCK